MRYNSCMRKKKILFLALILLCLGVVVLMFLLNPFRGLKLLASVVSATDTQTPSSETASDTVRFAEDEVSTFTTPEDRLIDTSEGSSTIAIEHGATESFTLPDIVVSDVATENGASRKYSYEYDTAALINAIHTYSNQLRENEGLAPLAFDGTLGTVATTRSTDMADHHTFSHTASDGCDLECRFERSDYATLSWGENIAEYEPYSRLTPQTLARSFVEKWARSSEHKRNLLSSEFTHEGVGVAMNGNRLVVTVVFARPE